TARQAPGGRKAPARVSTGSKFGWPLGWTPSVPDGIPTPRVGTRCSAGAAGNEPGSTRSSCDRLTPADRPTEPEQRQPQPDEDEAGGLGDHLEIGLDVVAVPLRIPDL